MKHVRLGLRKRQFSAIRGEAREWCERFHNDSWVPQENNGYLLRRRSAYSDFSCKWPRSVLRAAHERIGGEEVEVRGQ